MAKDKNSLMSYAEANDFVIDKNASAATSYYDLTNHKLVPLISTALTEAVRRFRLMKENGEIEEHNISIKPGTKMKFYLGEDKCKGKPFFTFKMGPVYRKSMSLRRKMTKAGGAGYKQALSNLFEDAHVDKSEYAGVAIAIWVPKTGGDPFLEHYPKS